MVGRRGIQTKEYSGFRLLPPRAHVLEVLFCMVALQFIEKETVIACQGRLGPIGAFVVGDKLRSAYYFSHCEYFTPRDTA